MRARAKLIDEVLDEHKQLKGSSLNAKALDFLSRPVHSRAVFF